MVSKSFYLNSVYHQCCGKPTVRWCTDVYSVLEVDPLRELQVWDDDVKVQKLGPGAFAIEVVQVVHLHTLLHGLKQGQVGLIEGLGEVNFCLGGGIPQGQMEQDKGTE